MKKRVLIIGAGVNKEIHAEIGLGSELLKDISDRVTDITSPDPRDKYFSNLLSKINIKQSVKEKFVGDIIRYKIYSEYASIDDFLHKVESLNEFNDYKEEYRRIAKISIVFHVLGYEGTTTQDNILEDIRNRKTWFSLLSAYINNDVFRHKNTDFNIITFNYDRIVEEYLLKSFQKDDSIIKFINDNIHHVYGRIGCLDKLIQRDLINGEKETLIRFGLPNDQIETIAKNINQINLVYEERDVNSSIKKIIKEADEILIMGYGFDYINNIKIGLDQLKRNPTIKIAVYPTDSSNKKEKIEAFFSNATIDRSTCTEFFNHHFS